MNEMTVKNTLRAWISGRAHLSSNITLADDKPILAAGILSSIDVTELILYIEHLKNEEVDFMKIDPKSLTNINSIYENFFN